MDLNVDLVQHAPAVKPAVKHIAHAAPHMLPIIKQGYSMLSMLIASGISAGIGFGLGWYIKGRGMTGVQIDLNNIKSDVENLKAKVFPTSTAAQATPAA
jgi:hypothetical protein